MSSTPTADAYRSHPHLPSKRQSAAILTVAMTALYAYADFTLPGQLTVAILYASSLVVAGWARSSTFLWLIAGLSVLLTYAGLAFGPQPPEGLLGASYINRSFVALGLVMIAGVVHQRMRVAEAVKHAHAILLSQNSALQLAHEALHHANDKLEGRVRHEVEHRMEIERTLQQAQRMESIGQLAGGIAHDFNNILAVVIGNLEMIRNRCADDDRCRRFTENALLGARQGASFTKQLLGFAGRRQIAPELVETDRVLADIESLARHVMPANIEFQTQSNKNLGPIFVDKAQLESALLNLVINARDAMPDGGRIVLSVSPITVGRDTAELASGDYAQFSVADTGYGMTAEVAARAFEPLFTTKGAGKGTGLGLSMVYAFTKQCGGAARIESVPGHGTTVRLLLPQRSIANGTAEVHPVSKASS